MKKKVLLVLTIFILCAFAFSACNMIVDDSDKDDLSHSHSYSKEIIEPTCSEQGYTEYTCDCGDTYIGDYVEKLTHVSSEWIIEEYSTCTEEGRKYKYCTACNEKIETGVIEKIDHEYSKIITQPTCTEKGFTTYVCSCGNSYISDEISKLGHDFDNYISDANATLEADGTKTAVCNRYGCNATDTVIDVGSKIIGVEGLAYTLVGDEYSVTGIGTCTDTNITIPEFYNGKKVTSIGEEAFKSCKSLKSIIMSDSVTDLGDRAFENCFLTSVILGKGISVISNSAFDSCIFLTNVVMTNSVTNIGYKAFQSCFSLQNISIPNSVTAVSEGAFLGCNKLQFNEYDNGLYLGNDTNNYLILIKAKSEDITSCIINENAKVIADNAFTFLDFLTKVTIGKNVKHIGAYAFQGCELASITIPNSVTSIGCWAFDRCELIENVYYTGDIVSWLNIDFYDAYSNPLFYGQGNLYIDNKLVTSVVIPDSFIEIKGYVFSGCISLTSITIPKSLTRIGDEAFYHCTSLENVYYTGDIASWCNIEFDDTSYDGHYKLESNPLVYAKNFYVDNNLIEDLVIPNTVREIKSYAFYGFDFTSITLPSSIVKIGNDVFNGGNWRLTSINYQGTMADWAKIDFSGDWNNATVISKIICTDGIIDL